jgi:hypothetical protein
LTNGGAGDVFDAHGVVQSPPELVHSGLRTVADPQRPNLLISSAK